MTEWPENLDVATLGIEPGSYATFRSSPPRPLTLEDVVGAMRAALKPRRALVPVELHHSSCLMWTTKNRLDCSCSPGWAHVTADAP